MRRIATFVLVSVVVAAPRAAAVAQLCDETCVDVAMIPRQGEAMEAPTPVPLGMGVLFVRAAHEPGSDVRLPAGAVRVFVTDASGVETPRTIDVRFRGEGGEGGLLLPNFHEVSFSPVLEGGSLVRVEIESECAASSGATTMTRWFRADADLPTQLSALGDHTLSVVRYGRGDVLVGRRGTCGVVVPDAPYVDVVAEGPSIAESLDNLSYFATGVDGILWPRDPAFDLPSFGEGFGGLRRARIAVVCDAALRAETNGLAPGAHEITMGAFVPQLGFQEGALTPPLNVYLECPPPQGRGAGCSAGPVASPWVAAIVGLGLLALRRRARRRH